MKAGRPPVDARAAGRPADGFPPDAARPHEETRVAVPGGEGRP